ncbi:MAG: phytanoyl-CoA dioxygenase family protein [Methylacidiphilales bacterium]|nr:phytanoyl-CoA dioxygenase family protein [Candidatus Methylacidiphilales bacterium]
MKPTVIEPRLTSQQVEAYRRDGYLIHDKPVLPQEKFLGLKTCFEKILADLPAEERPEAMDVPHFMHPELFEWAFHDAILDLVEPIVGSNIALFSTHFICKPKGNGRRVPWHEDSAYWKGQVDPMEVVTVWLALDPSLKQNGCMMVIPCTHRTGRRGFSDYSNVDPAKNVFVNEIIQEHRDDSRRVYVELQPNHCSLHDGRIQHGSEPNTSTLRRCGWTLRFTSTAVKFADFKGAHQVYLARGRDLGGNIYADPTKAYPEVMAARGASTRYKNSH